MLTTNVLYECIVFQAYSFAFDPPPPPRMVTIQMSYKWMLLVSSAANETG